ncbi:Lrp/AsnC family transcriptional regulator [Corynebacterium lowii]|uniref:Leucine-responsive regulatory protein n=1 Tax=Corynebacterium lowii TaxID=1544413 RepID=A0A0N8VZI3_9CORY|nr:Lrp/AsnC family transcriptional regulator [Corynebacterium lowii]KQB83978.1 Leucine-responsive regulatory protein [Corynebacterium lowii]MDP9852772.1 DNA-binding Lrp family transcriptional regulator [Corynebacterium lowii]
MHIDNLSRTILATLQSNARTTAAGLADRTGAAASTCLRRLRALESDGVIRGYHADIDPAALGFSLQVIAFVTLEREDRATIEAFEEKVVQIPQILSAERLFGDPDYLLRVVARDLEDYQRLRDNHLGGLPGLNKITSTMVMRTLVEKRPLPVAEA